MQLIAAIIIAVALALPAPANASEEPTKRNPVVWLLSDIGEFLQNATNSLKSETPVAEDIRPEPKKTATVQHETESGPEFSDSKTTFKNPFKALFQDIARLFQPASDSAVSLDETEMPEVAVAANTPEKIDIQPDTPNDTAAASTSEENGVAAKRNPIEWLFSDLANLLTPTLEIDDNPVPLSVVETPEAVEAETVTAAEEAIDANDVQAHAVEETSGDTATPAPRNPVSWLLSDLATLFAPTDTPIDAAIQEEVIVATPATSENLLPASAPAEQKADTAEEKPAKEILVAESTERIALEPAPWSPKPSTNIFDPHDSIFGGPSAPARTVEATPTATKVAENSTTVPLRQRPPYRPEARNHRTLGSEHKAVTPDPADEDIFTGVLEQIFGTDVSGENNEPLANKISDRIVAEEKLDLGYSSPDAPDPDKELTHIGNGSPLLDLDLYLGRNKAIGQAYQSTAHNSAACIERSLHGSVFCLEELNWPAAEMKSFDADTSFILPGEGIIRYENGTSSRIYAVFNATHFADVIKLMQRRFGPPQEREIGWMHILEAPKLPNTTFRWKAVTPDRSDTIVLEVRNYDDIRRSFADMNHGMVRLFRMGSRPIFKHISTMDLMLMQRRNAAQTSAKAKTQ